jgi:predicted MFS family arabinose efflux permease
MAFALVIGLGSVAAQILVPLAAELAGAEDRGRVVGQVMSGLLVGILLARTLSGLVAGVTNWRVVYGVAAALVIATALVLARLLPEERERPRLHYSELLRSTIALFGSEPVLRRRALFGALGFAGFSVFWTTIAFMLAGPPYHYGDIVIGLFGLVGAAGAVCASFAGRLADRGKAAITTTVFSVAVAASFLPIWLGRHSLGWLIVGIAVLDIGVQGLQVTNQSIIYTLSDARSRITSTYMVCYFVGGAVGSAVAGDVYGAGGWAAVCWLGAGIGAVATIASMFDHFRPARASKGGVAVPAR